MATGTITVDGGGGERREEVAYYRALMYDSDLRICASMITVKNCLHVTVRMQVYMHTHCTQSQKVVRHHHSDSESDMPFAGPSVPPMPPLGKV